jgi:hypothetical protein
VPSLPSLTLVSLLLPTQLTQPRRTGMAGAREEIEAASAASEWVIEKALGQEAGDSEGDESTSFIGTNRGLASSGGLCEVTALSTSRVSPPGPVSLFHCGLGGDTPRRGGRPFPPYGEVRFPTRNDLPSAPSCSCVCLCCRNELCCASSAAVAGTAPRNAAASAAAA